MKDHLPQSWSFLMNPGSLQHPCLFPVLTYNWDSADCPLPPVSTTPRYHSGNLRMERELTDPLCSGLGSSCAAFVSNLMTKMHVRVPVLPTSDRVGAARDAFVQILFSGAVCTQKISAYPMILFFCKDCLEVDKERQSLHLLFLVEETQR